MTLDSNSTGMRRVRRAPQVGGGGSRGGNLGESSKTNNGMIARGTMARGDDGGTSSQRAMSARDAIEAFGAPGTAGTFAGATAGMSLSEKLRRQELLEEQRQQQQRMPRHTSMTDSDHSIMTSGSVSKQKKMPPMDRSSGNNGGIDNMGNIMDRNMGADAISSGRVTSSASHATNMSLIGRLQTPFQHSKRTMSMVYHAFRHDHSYDTNGGSTVRQKMLHLMNCTKKNGGEEDHNERDRERPNHEFETKPFLSSPFCHSMDVGSNMQQWKQGRLIRFIFAIVILSLIFLRFDGRRHGLSRHEGIYEENDIRDGEERGIVSPSSPLLSYFPEEASSPQSNEFLSDLSSLRGNSSPINPRNPTITGNTAAGNHHSSPNSNALVIHHAYFPHYLQHFSNLTTPYNPEIETPYFWDVHFSGESIAEAVFGHCHRLVQACEFGLRQPNYNEDVSVFAAAAAIIVDAMMLAAVICCEFFFGTISTAWKFPFPKMSARWI